MAVDERVRVILICNKRSSKYVRVEEEIVKPLREMKNIMFGKYDVQPTDVDANAKLIAKILKDGDIVLAVGGDGTAAIAINGALRSQKEVKFWSVGYGNFNDSEKTVSHLRSGAKIYPLEVRVNGEIFRYALNYLTVGMFAESTKIFDEKKTRKHLQKVKQNLVYSLIELAKWYFKNKKREFVPKCKVNGRWKKISDYIALNGRSMAKIMRGGDWCVKKRNFLSAMDDLSKLGRLMKFMLISVMFGVPGERTNRDVIEFEKPSEVELQTEGEYKRFREVEKIEVKKNYESRVSIL